MCSSDLFALALVLWCFWNNWRQTRRLASGGLCDPKTDFAYNVSRAVTINVFLLLVMGWSGHNLFRYNWQWLAAFGAIALCCLRARAAALDAPPLWQVPAGQVQLAA